MVISLLVGITAMGSLQAFTVTQRQAAAIGTTFGGGVTSVDVVKYELSQAGRGLYADGAPLCTQFNFSVDDKVIANGTDLPPLAVSWDDDGYLTLDIRYASALEAATPVSLASTLTTDAAELDGFLPASVGQAVLLAPEAGTAGICTVRTVTEVTAANTFKGQQIHFGVSGQHNKSAFSNAQAYPSGSRVYLLGTMEAVSFQQTADALLMTRPLAAQSAALVAGVRGFAVQLGVTDSVTGALSKWVYPETEAATAVDWSALTSGQIGQLGAIRVALVLQAPQKQKPSADGTCDATPTADSPTLFGKALTLGADPTCFKYRSFSTVVPLRNIAQM